MSPNWFASFRYDRQLELNCLLEASSTVDQEIFLSLIERKLMMMLMGVDETQWSISLPVSSRPSPHLNLIKFYRKRRVFWALFCPWTTNNLNIKQFCLIFRQQITVFPTQSSVSTILYIWIIRRAANLSFYWANRGTFSSPVEFINLQSLLQCWTFSLTALQ